MAKNTKWKGYTTDMTFGWVTQDLGPDWQQWQQYAAEWLATQDAGMHHRLRSLKHFLFYLKTKVPYAVDVTAMFRGHPGGHKVSSEEFNDYLLACGSKVNNQNHVTYAVALCDHILKHHLSAEDDDGASVPYMDSLNAVNLKCTNKQV